MKRSVAKNFFKGLFFVLCLFLLGWMVKVAGARQLWQTLTSMPGTIVGCVAIWGVGYLLNAESFRVILHATCDKLGIARRHLGWKSVLQLTISGYAINYITPFGLLGGEPYRVIALRPLFGTRKATRSVVQYSMMHIGSHFCLWLLSIAWAILMLREPLAEYWTGLVVTFFVLLVLLILIGYYYRQDVFARSLLLELVSRLVNVCEYWLVMHALGFVHFDYADALLVVAFSSLLSNILFFSPLQMGTREGGIMLALQLLVPSVVSSVGTGAPLLAVAVALSFATRLRELFWILIGLLMMRMKGNSDNENIEQ